MAKCLLFDCDGTLVDSELLNCEAMAEELEHAGIAEHADSLFQRYKGRNFYKVIDDLEQRHGIKLDDQFADRFRHRAAIRFSQHLRPVPGIHKALRALPHPKCVVSNAPLKKIRHELELAELEAFFSNRLYSAYEVESWKPDPDLFLYAADSEGCLPAECVVIEDSKVGVEAAVKAGIPVVLYDSTGVSDDSWQATITISSMHDLAQAISRLSV